MKAASLNQSDLYGLGFLQFASTKIYLKKPNKDEPSSNESAEESFVLDEYTSDDDKSLGSNAASSLSKTEGLSATTTKLMEKSVFVAQVSEGFSEVKAHTEC